MKQTAIVSFGQNPKIKDFKITILSTMLSDTHIGEWGFSALIEADGQRILFDTGSREETVLQNAKELNINLDGIDNVFLSHNHKDHTGGLITLRKNHPTSFSNAHIGEGIFYPRPNSRGSNHYILNNKIWNKLSFTTLSKDKWLSAAYFNFISKLYYNI